MIDAGVQSMLMCTQTMKPNKGKKADKTHAHVEKISQLKSAKYQNMAR